MIQFKLADMCQGVQSFTVNLREKETPRMAFQRCLDVAANRAVRDFSAKDAPFPKDELFVVRFDPWRHADGSIRFEMALGPTLHLLGKGLATLSFVDGKQPDAPKPPETRVEQTRREMLRAAMVGEAESLESPEAKAARLSEERRQERNRRKRAKRERARPETAR